MHSRPSAPWLLGRSDRQRWRADICGRARDIPRHAGAVSRPGRGRAPPGGRPYRLRSSCLPAGARASRPLGFEERAGRHAPDTQTNSAGRRLTSDPNRSSLGLLPSGPDPVGEWLVHRQPPSLYIGGTRRDCKRQHDQSRTTTDAQMNNADSLPGWSLHPQLEQDSVTIADLPLSRLLLSRDANYPWLLLVPRHPGASELIDLDVAEQAQLMTEIDTVSCALKAVTACDKLNVAAIGNVVPQLHFHIVARR